MLQFIKKSSTKNNAESKVMLINWYDPANVVGFNDVVFESVVVVEPTLDEEMILVSLVDTLVAEVVEPDIPESGVVVVNGYYGFKIIWNYWFQL